MKSLKEIIKSFNLGLILIFISIFTLSCESLGIWDEEEIIPFEIGDSLYFSLQDINQNSSSYGDLIGPQDYSGKVVFIYFTTNETWDTCVDRFGHLYEIFEDKIDENTGVSKAILIGVGKNNSIPITEILADNKVTPWVKDESGNKTWDKFDAINRDLFIIDKIGTLHSKENLTDIPNEYFYMGISSTIDQLINQ